MSDSKSSEETDMKQVTDQMLQFTLLPEKCEEDQSVPNIPTSNMEAAARNLLVGQLQYESVVLEYKFDDDSQLVSDPAHVAEWGVGLILVRRGSNKSQVALMLYPTDMALMRTHVTVRVFVRIGPLKKQISPLLCNDHAIMVQETCGLPDGQSFILHPLNNEQTSFKDFYSMELIFEK